MTIPNSKLETWTNLGSTTNSKLTHEHIRKALSNHTWPKDIKYADYLQGSYANTTNIRGDSDVDIVIECTSMFRHNEMDPDLSKKLGFQNSKYSLAEFRKEALSALTAAYGKDNVDATGGNSVKVIPKDTSNHLYADVIICLSYRHYNEDGTIRAYGIAFNNQKTGAEITNYPKLHIKNGETKNANCGSDYKKSVRMFKNARRYMVKRSDDLKGLYPSYFVECLVYNLPDEIFRQDTWSKVFLGGLQHWGKLRDDDDFGKLTTQSGMHYLVGDNAVQWEKKNVKSFINNMITLWNDWSE